jgi:hypothetical protein
MIVISKVQPGKLHTQHRRGSVWPLLLACLVLVLACIALAVDSALIWQARQELQVAADASALAAVLELADDRLLISRDGSHQEAVLRGMEYAKAIANKHHVLGKPLQLDLNDDVPDVVPGFFDTVAGFQPARSDEWDNPLLNAIEVTGRRTSERGTPVGLFFTRLFRLPSSNVAASATAVLDRNIVGFRPTGQLHVPLMPIALLSDPSGLEEQSWEAQVDKPLSTGGGTDEYVFNKSSRQWFSAGDDTKAGDGLPEFTLRLPLGSLAVEESNGQVLQIGKPSTEVLLRQVERGLLADDLEASQGQLALGWDGMLPIETQTLPTSNTLQRLRSLFAAIHQRGEARIWPLYLPSSSGVLLRGFVAARIAHIEQSESQLMLVLQPTVLTTGTALTQPSASSNAYIGKIKLVR